MKHKWNVLTMDVMFIVCYSLFKMSLTTGGELSSEMTSFSC